MLHHTIQTFVAVLLATNYFAFQVELFEEEYEQNHRRMAEECSLAAPSLNWESFDKNSAQKAFVIQTQIGIELLQTLTPEPPDKTPLPPRPRLIRDRSPPEIEQHI